MYCNTALCELYAFEYGPIVQKIYNTENTGAIVLFIYMLHIYIQQMAKS